MAPLSDQQYRCVIQLTSADPKVYKSILRQIANLLDYMPGQVSIEMVCHGASSHFCQSLNNPDAKEIENLSTRGVNFMICSKMMEGARLASSELIPCISIIASGIGHLVLRQHEGWSYVKAGF